MPVNEKRQYHYRFGIGEKMGVNEKTIKRDIEKLKKEGKIRRVVSARGGHWEVEIKIA
jgi:predicted HTH transcriptional regulator